MSLSEDTGCAGMFCVFPQPFNVHFRNDTVLDWSVCICLTQLYAGRDMYRICYIKNNYMFRPFTLAIFRLRNEKT